MWWSWGGFFDVENRQAKIENDKQLSLSPGFWDDNARATSILKETKVNEYWVNLFYTVDTAVEDFAVLFDFWKEGETSEEEAKEAYNKAIAAIEDAEFKSTLNEPEDELPPDEAASDLFLFIRPTTTPAAMAPRMSRASRTKSHRFQLDFLGFSSLIMVLPLIA